MKNSPRLVRVFISSTFRDFLGERDELVKKVFPELRRRCRERQVELLEVDLRWGITEEQSRRGETLSICLKEIDRCRPSSPVFFIGLLGERYGWVPEADFYPRNVLEDSELDWIHEHIGGRSVTELEILHGVLRNPQMAARAFFYFREDGYEKRHWDSIHAAYPDLQPEAFTNASEADPVSADSKQRDLKRRICESGLQHRPRTYETPENAGAMVLEDLWAQIDAAYPAAEVPDEWERQRIEHAVFAQSRTKGYVSRTELFETLDAVFKQDGPTVKVVTGSSGGGKSALMAAWMEQCAERLPERCFVHYIGGTPESGTCPGLVRRLMETIRRWGVVDKAVPDDLGEAVRLLPKWLEAAAAGKSDGVLLVLDALNQIEDPSDRSLWWLPSVLPAGVRLIASTLPGPAEDALRKRGWMGPDNVVEVHPLSTAERHKIIAQYLSRFAKELEEPVVQRLAQAPQTGNALFLKVVLDELRLRASHEALYPMVERMLEATGPVELFSQVLKELEEFDRDRPNLVREALGYLHAARRGLTESELLQLLSDQPEPASHPLPHRIWAPLYLALEESLVNRNGRLGFFHDYLREAIEREYLDEESERIKIHARFGEVALAWNTERFSPSLRTYGLAFGAYHLRREGDHEKLWSLLEDEDYRGAQRAEFNRVDEAVEALREGVERYAQRNGATGEDDTRLCWLTLRCGEVAQEARTNLKDLFEAFRTGPQDSMERVDTALMKLSSLSDQQFADACLLLLYLECSRPRKKSSAGFIARCDRVLEKLAARLADLTLHFFRCPRWIARSLLENLPGKKIRHLFLKQMGIAFEDERRPTSVEERLESYLEVVCQAATSRGKFREAYRAIRRLDALYSSGTRDALLDLASRSTSVDQPRSRQYAIEALECLSGQESAEETVKVVSKLLSADCVELARKVLSGGIRRARKKIAASQIRDFAVYAITLRTGRFEKLSCKLATAAYERSNEFAQESDAFEEWKDAEAAILANLATAKAMSAFSQIEEYTKLCRRASEILESAEKANFGRDAKLKFRTLIEIARQTRKLGLSDFTEKLLQKSDVSGTSANEDSLYGDLRELGARAEVYSKLCDWKRAFSAMERIPRGPVMRKKIYGSNEEFEEHPDESFINFRAEVGTKIFLRLHRTGHPEAAFDLVSREQLRGSQNWTSTLDELAGWHAKEGLEDQAVETFIELLSNYSKEKTRLSSEPCSEGIILWTTGHPREAVARFVESFPECSVPVRYEFLELLIAWHPTPSLGVGLALNWLKCRAITSGNRDLLCQMARLNEALQTDISLLAIEHLLERGNFNAAWSLMEKSVSREPGLALLSAHIDLLSPDEDEQVCFWAEYMMELDDKTSANSVETTASALSAHHFRALRKARSGQIRAAMAERKKLGQISESDSFTESVAERLALQGRFQIAVKFAMLDESVDCSFRALVAIARTAHVLGKIRRARKTLLRAISLWPPERYASYEGAVNLAQLYTEIGWENAAIRTLEKEDVCHPKALRRWQKTEKAVWASDFLSGLGRFRSAEYWAERATCDAEQLRLFNRISERALDARKPGLARRIAHKAAALARGVRDRDGLFELAESLIRLGSFRLAASIGRQILRLGKEDVDSLRAAPDELDARSLIRLARTAAVLSRAREEAAAEGITQQIFALVRSRLKECPGELTWPENLFPEMISLLAQARPSLVSELEELAMNRVKASGEIKMPLQWFIELSEIGLRSLQNSVVLYVIQTSKKRIDQLWKNEADPDELQRWLDSLINTLSLVLKHLPPEERILDELRQINRIVFSLYRDSGSVLLCHLIGAMRQGFGPVQIHDRLRFDRARRWIRALQTLNPASHEWGRTLSLLLTASYALSGDLQHTRSMTERLPGLGLDLARSSFTPRRCKIRDGESFTLQIGDKVELAFHFCPEGEFSMDGFPGRTGEPTNTNPSRVRITHPFWIADAPVSRQMWDELGMDAWQNRPPSQSEDCRLATWESATKWVKGLNRRYAPQGWQFAIPTEAQWEYATKKEGSSIRGTHPEWCCDLFVSSLPAGDDPGVWFDEKALPKIDYISRILLSRRVVRHWDSGSAGSYPHGQSYRSCAKDGWWPSFPALRLVLIRKPTREEARRSAEVHQNGLAEILVQSGENENASVIFSRLLRSNIRRYGARHPASLELMQSLAKCLMSGRSRFRENNLFKAERLTRDALRGFLELEGPGHPNTLECMSVLGGILLEHLRNLTNGYWTVRRRMNSIRHCKYRPPWTIGVPLSDFSSKIKARLEEEAESLFRGALKGMDENLGAEHPQREKALLALQRFLEMKDDSVRRGLL